MIHFSRLFFFFKMLNVTEITSLYFKRNYLFCQAIFKIYIYNFKFELDGPKTYCLSLDG